MTLQQIESDLRICLRLFPPLQPFFLYGPVPGVTAEALAFFCQRDFAPSGFVAKVKSAGKKGKGVDVTLHSDDGKDKDVVMDK